MRQTQIEAFLQGGGEIGALVRGTDWAATPLGPVEAWPQSLRTTLGLLLNSRYPMFVFWGPSLIKIYNDAYRPILGVKHPEALGRPAPEVWPEIWSDIEPLVERALAGEPTWSDDLRLFMHRRGFTEEVYFTFSYSPIPDETGGIGGMFCACTETTAKVLAERRLRTLRDLAAGPAEARSAVDACALSAEVLDRSSGDVPFALIYRFDSGGTRAELVGAAGIAPASGAPLVVDASNQASTWPLLDVAAQRRAIQVDGLATRFRVVPPGPWPEPPCSAVVLPVVERGTDRLAAALVLGISARRPFDDEYRGWFGLIASQVSASIANARAAEDERRKADALAELDRAKTAFFSNVSHEFRTPLTLMLGPIEDLQLTATRAEDQAQLSILGRNARRLLKLTNTLLDVAQIEAGRARAQYLPTDLAQLTRDVASAFRSAIERAGMEFVVRCEPLPRTVLVDRDMWEKIVLNLLSNAFKYTLRGRIEIALTADEAGPVLTVSDTGAGIPVESLDKVFDRFHRIASTTGRTQEGSGIGLALVSELVRLHDGSVHVTSAVGQGSTFTVRVPFAPAVEQPAGGVEPPRATGGARPYVDEALRWLDGDAAGASRTAAAPDAPLPASHPASARPRILIADDNADMRDYLARLLGGRFDVETVADGERAHAAALRRRPDLVLADVMMPQLDGFALLHRLRSDPRTATVPLMLISARAGEEARIEGLQQGADDYVVKPFSARELMARVEARLEISRLRRDSEERTGLILESLSDGFLGIDRDWRVTYVNSAAERLSGLSRAGLLGRTLWEVFPAAAATPHEAEFRRAVSDRVTVELEYFHEPSGRWFSVRAHPLLDEGLSVSFRDTTERRRGDELVRTANERFMLATRAVKGLVYEWDPRTGKAFRSDGLIDLLGFAPHEAGDDVRWWNERVHPDDLIHLHDLYQVAIAGHRPSIEAQYRIRHRDGTYRIVRDHSLLIWDDHALTRQIGFTTDVTDAVTSQRALEEARAEAHAANRAKDDFIAMLGHELRNPLSPMLAALQLMRLRGQTSRELDVIERQVTHITRLVEDLLDVSRIAQGKVELRPQVVEASEIVARALETVTPLLEQRRHVLDVAVDARGLGIQADVDRMAQVIGNLLTNAAKYSEPGARIRLSAARHGPSVRLSVADEGMGIAPEMLGRVFDAFVQQPQSLDHARGGLGLGLTIVRSLVQQHGGAVRVDSAGLGRGSEFIVELPAIEAPETPRPPAA